MSDKQRPLDALRVLETQLVRLRSFVAGYEERGEPIPFETELALEDILKQIYGVDSEARTAVIGPLSGLGRLAD